MSLRLLLMLLSFLLSRSSDGPWIKFIGGFTRGEPLVAEKHTLFRNCGVITLINQPTN